MSCWKVPLYSVEKAPRTRGKYSVVQNLYSVFCVRGPEEARGTRGDLAAVISGETGLLEIMNDSRATTY